MPYELIYKAIFDYPEFGWLIVFAYLIIEIRTKKGRIYQLNNQLNSAIVVIRAIARTTDEVKTSKVDEYLAENGSEPSDFISRLNYDGEIPDLSEKGSAYSEEGDDNTGDNSEKGSADSEEGDDNTGDNSEKGSADSEEGDDNTGDK